ncbi:MAG: monovalent cation/H+ antiporter complex subunit F [Candidatus Acetothermia bacterium]
MMFKISVEVLIGISMVFTLLRLFKGPEVLDRLLGYSSLSAKIILLLVLEGLFNQRTFYVNLALVYAVLSFLGIVIIGRYVEREI